MRDHDGRVVVDHQHRPTLAVEQRHAGDQRRRQRVPGLLGPLRPRHRTRRRPGLRDLRPGRRSSIESSTRQQVESEATGPNTAAWSASVAMSLMHSPPSASITARSVSTRPGSCAVCGAVRCANTADSCAGQRGLVGQIGQQPRPGMRHDTGAISGHLDRRASTSSVHVEGAFLFAVLSPQQAQNPVQARHFRSSTRRHHQLDLEEPGLVPSASWT